MLSSSFLEITIPLLLFNVFSVDSSMLRVMERFLIVTQYSDGLNRFAQLDQFCERMLEIIASDDVMLMMSDEAHFHLDGYGNKQNCRFWAAENPQELHQRPLHTAKVSVWCGISKVGSLVLTFMKKKGLQ